MYLKRLEIQGFKSFAHKTVLDFLFPKNGFNSVTAVVGPNGAGKSNIVDAVRWVMGETSLKNIRGKKSEDIIFNGSELKEAVSAAEVTMVLDNSETATNPHPALSTAVERVRNLPSVATEGEGGGFEDDVLSNLPEITITRRLYRSGDSECLVNNRSVRLFDIHLLLAKAQFAEHAYSIVSQGTIDRLLTVGPAERKDWFDEACGIKEYQIKQHQASLKLARTEENMQQAEVLLKEVEPRLKILARQVKKLEKRQEVEIELTAIQEKYYFTLYSKNKREADELKTTLRKLDEEYRQVFSLLEIAQQELAKLAHASSRQEVFQSLQNRYQSAVRAKNELERQLAIVEGRLHTEYQRAGAQNVGWLQDKIFELKNIHKKLEQDLSSALSIAKREEVFVLDQKKASESIALLQTQLKLKISRLESELMKDQSEQSWLRFSGLTAVKAILAAKNQLGKIYGLVAELGEVDEQYRLALEVAAGAHLSSLVVEDEAVARKCIEYLRANRLGVATFLPLNKIVETSRALGTSLPVGAPGVIGRALDLIKFNSKFENIFSFVFGNTLVVDDLRAVERLGIGSGRMVTLEGDLVERQGVMRGGYRNRKNNLGFSASLSFTEEDRAAELTSQINLTKQTLQEQETLGEAAKAKLWEHEVRAQAAGQKASLVEEECRARQTELANLEHELSLLKATPEEYGEQLIKLAQNKEELAANIAKSEQEIAAVGTEIEDYNNKEEEKQRRIFSWQEQMQKHQDEVNRVVGRRNELNIQLAKVETKQEDLSEEVANDLKTSLQSIIERAPVVAPWEEVGEISNTIQKLKYQLSLIGGIDDEVVEEHSQTKERYDFLIGQIKDLRLAVSDLQEMVAELSELMTKKRSAAFRKIRQEFTRYFKILFDGGKADLEEVYGPPPSSEEDSGEVKEGEQNVNISSQPDEQKNINEKKETVLTGIEVIANPPGKKVKYLNMLSGGERTLTSIALICAILHINPSPFVLFDEVEAALDEANTLRFVKIVTELASQSQFIIVTHNRVTMHAADALYGVVMGADGISKLLSVKIDEAEKYDNQPAVDKN